ncbi:MAG: hypothetical protein IIT78_00460 [Mycoplasmataceae bacterium]|nr:hypothetical protein [Mycoplasmataceae bacterium]
MFKWVKIIFKKDDKNKPFNKKWKNIVFWIMGFSGFGISVLGLCFSNTSNNIVVNNYTYSDSKTTNNKLINNQSLNSNKNIVEIKKIDHKDKYYFKNLQTSLLLSNEYDLITNYWINPIQTNNLFIENNQLIQTDNQFTQIIINSTFEIDDFIKNLQIQKDALGAAGLIISLFLCVLTFLNLNIAIFCFGFILGLTGISCAISSVVLDSFVRTFNEMNKKICQKYINISYLLPWLDVQKTISCFKEIIPLFLNLKLELKKHINLIGTKQAFQQIDKNITSLQKIINDLNSND